MIGVPAAQGVGVGIQEELQRVFEQMRRTVYAETAKLSVSVGGQSNVQTAAARSVAASAEAKREVVTKEKVIGIEFRGTGAGIARMLKPELDAEDRRIGTKLVLGGV